MGLTDTRSRVFVTITRKEARTEKYNMTLTITCKS